MPQHVALHCHGTRNCCFGKSSTDDDRYEYELLAFGLAARYILYLLGTGCPLLMRADELDSYMYQTVGHEIIPLIAEGLGLPLYRRGISGSSVDISGVYKPTSGDEVEDLLLLLQAVKEKHPDIDGVSVGAILSDYQRTRVENVCARLNLTCYAYLWRRPQDELLGEMIACGLKAVIIKVAAMGLCTSHLGQPIRDMHGTLTALHRKFDLHVCGEGGEYESLALDGPLFHSRIVVDQSEVIMHSSDAIAAVAYLRIRKAHLEPKSDRPPPTHELRVAHCRELLCQCSPDPARQPVLAVPPSALPRHIAPFLSPLANSALTHSSSPPSLPASQSPSPTRIAAISPPLPADPRSSSTTPTTVPIVKIPSMARSSSSNLALPTAILSVPAMRTSVSTPSQSEPASPRPSLSPRGSLTAVSVRCVVQTTSPWLALSCRAVGPQVC